MSRTATALFTALLIGALGLPGVSAAQEDPATARNGRLHPDGTHVPPTHAKIAASASHTMRAGSQYRAGEVREFFLGDDYRALWSKPVDVPVIDLAATAGGLTPTGSAGGLQTSLLFLEGADGRDFILRKIEKKAAESLPEGTRRTIVEDIAQDQISSLQPYGAFIISGLARAAGILHTDPALVVVPDDPRLGEHRDAFAGELALLERKVDEDVSDEARFAYSEEVIDFESLLERLAADRAVKVDERAFARARLFDMLIGDRDRHDGQWFWASVDHGRRYLPLPIDRDFAFARFDGLLNRTGRFSGKIILRKQTHFGDKIDNLVGLNYQGAKLDIRFTSELEREDWLEIAEDLKKDVTDAVIDEAVRAWPQAVYDEVGPETGALLKSRRDDLPRAAEEYYKLLMQKVDVVGTDRPEHIEISRSSAGYVDVVLQNPSTGRETFRRRFLASETDEVRIFGLGGDDEFYISGPPPGGIILFAVGGDGDDVFRSQYEGRSRAVRFYDTELDEASRKFVDFDKVDDPSDNDYTLHRYEFDRVGPAFSFDYDSGEGVYIGGGVKTTRYGFMREPYASKHVIVAKYAPQSRGYNVHYDGEVNEILGEWDAGIKVDILDFDRFDDFYGLGNETPGSDANRARYIARFRWVTAYPAFRLRISPIMSLRIGPYFEYADIEPPSGVSEDNLSSSAYTADQLTDKYFGGIESQFDVDGRDSSDVTSSGLRWLAQAGVHTGLRNTRRRFVTFSSELSYFLNPLSPVTLAFRAGGATNIGDFTFYQANTLGGSENLRGYRKTRFAGRTSTYGNAELRLKLTDFNVYLTRGELGVFGFYDIGRVWTDDENSDLWHQGYGAGAWATPFDALVVSGSIGFSNEGSIFDLSFGMFF